MPQSISSEVSDVRPIHYDSTESTDPLLGVVKFTLARVILQHKIANVEKFFGSSIRTWIRSWLTPNVNYAMIQSLLSICLFHYQVSLQ